MLVANTFFSNMHDVFNLGITEIWYNLSLYNAVHNVKDRPGFNYSVM